MRPAYIIDRRAGSSVLAVQTVPIEEHQVRSRRAFDRFVDAKETFDGCPTPTLGLRVELAEPNGSRRRLG